MSDCSIKLEVGKTYISRDNKIYGPLLFRKGDEFPFYVAHCVKTWLPSGKWDTGLENYPHDLVRELIEPDAAADPVNNPSHYASGEVECIDAIQASMSVEAFRGYCKGNVQKYVWRYEEKGGAESLRKAEWYLKRLLATFDADA